MKNFFNRAKSAARPDPGKMLVLNAAAQEATLYLYDEISADWGIGAKDVISALAQAADAPVLHIRINSPGGSVFEGQAICEAIRRFEGKTIAHIDSLAASAASSIAIACDEVEISPGAFYMIHNASGMVWGDKADMRSMADVLEKIESAILAGYANKTGKDMAELVAWMDAETWFTADEAVANGFADRISEAPAKVKNSWNLGEVFKHPPKDLATVEPEPAPEENPHGERVAAINRSRVAHLAPRQQRL